MEEFQEVDLTAIQSDKAEVLIMDMDMISSICFFKLFIENEIVDKILR